MIDILLIAEIAWSMLFMGQRTMERTLLYLGGLVASGYVASISSPWATNVLLGHSKVTLAWITNQVRAPAEPVGLLTTVLPPATALSDHLLLAQSIALHVAAALLVFIMTLAVFAVFVVIAQLTFALWDYPDEPIIGHRYNASYLFGLAGGVYIAVLTGTTLANLSWLKSFSTMSDSVAHSILLGIASNVISAIHLHGLSLVG